MHLPIFPDSNYCAAVGASALESANVVGYQEVSLVAGAKALASGFLEIGTNGVNLTSIVPKGYGDKCNGTINIQRLAADGTTADMWKWYDGQTAGKFKGKTGWFIGSSTTQVTSESDVTIAAGEALWVTGNGGETLTIPAPTGIAAE